MNGVQYILSIIASLGVGSYFTTKFIDRRNRFLDSRKEIYSQMAESLSGFFDTEDKNSKQIKLSEGLKQYRQIQIWGAPEVVRSIKVFIKIMDISILSSQKNKDQSYKNVILSMRNDLLKENILPNFILKFINKNRKELNEDDIDVYGKIQ